jgi:hypothetical protein
MSESRIMRSRTADLEQYNDRLAPNANDCDVSVLGQTATKTTYPTVANAVYFINTANLDGSDAEGSTATFVLDSGSLFALNLGGTVPPVGTNVVVTSAGGRWVFRFG